MSRYMTIHSPILTPDTCQDVYGSDHFPTPPEINPPPNSISQLIHKRHASLCVPRHISLHQPLPQISSPYWDCDVITTSFGRQCSLFATNLVFSADTLHLSPNLYDQCSISPLSCPHCIHLSSNKYFAAATPTALMPYPAFLHYANETFRVLQGGYKIRISEATHALCLFEQVVSEHINHPPFTLLRNNLHILLLSCALVTHKFSTDRPIRNICWSESFGVPLTLLNLSEVSLLYLLGWRVAVSEGELGRIKAQCEEAM